MNKNLLKEIYDQYAGEIRRYIYYRAGNEEVANDITQETFIKIWEKNFTFNPKKIRALLYKIAGGLFIDYIRKTKYEADFLEHLKFKLIETSSENNDAEYYQQKCERALRNLTEKERTVFLMNRMEGLTYADIAECLNLSQKAIEKRMSKALKKIKIEDNE